LAIAQALQTHCKHGHEFDAANTVLNRDGSRGCRECNRAKGRRHYKPRTRQTAPERFWAKVDTSGGASGCWLWRVGDGYAQFYFEGRVQPAHRVAYELVVGPIPDGLELDHLCRNHPCVNPAHMEPVTHQVNVLRGVGITARRAQQTHCLRGHPLSGANLYMRSDGGRECRACRPARRAEHRSGRG
jgi:hypothetical protein